MRQKNGSYAPVKKVAAGVVGGAVATILIWIIQEMLGRSIPGEVAAAITTVVVFAVGYITPPGKGEQMPLADVWKLVARIKELKALFLRSAVGDEVELKGVDLRIFGGRWTPTLKRRA